MRDAVDDVLDAVNRDMYVRQLDGQMLPQTSALEITATMLRLLDVRPTMHVLEIGTGSGYSTALLAHLVGPAGSVVSLDVDSELTRRAIRLLLRERLHQVTVAARDGRVGYPSAAPFDRLIVWVTADMVPTAWIEQMCIDGLIVAPIKLVPLAGPGIAVVCGRIKSSGSFVGERIIPGTFAPLTAAPLHYWYGPASEADVVIEAGGQLLAWVSAAWLRGHDRSADRLHIVRKRRTIVPQSSPLNPLEDAKGFWAYLLAARPTSLTTAWTQDNGLAFGCSQPRSIALLSLKTSGCVEAGEHSVADVVEHWITEWRAVGCPGFDQLQPLAERGPNGLRVQATMRNI